MKRTTWTIVTALLIAGLAAQAQAGREAVARDNKSNPDPKSVPWTINYQGYLAGSDTLPIQGNVTLVFNIYDAPSGGSLLWGPEAHAVVPVTKGFFNVQLGSIQPFTAGTFDGNQRYMEIVVNGTALAPRKPLGSVGYAIRSQRADTADCALAAPLARPISPAIAEAEIADNAVTSAKIADGAIVRADAAANFKAPYADTADYAKTGVPTAHDHLGQTWISTSSTLGLGISLGVNTTSAVYGKYVTVSNAGSGPAYGGSFDAGGTGTGYKFGVLGEASAPAGSFYPAYGTYGVSSHAGTGAAYGSYGYSTHAGTGAAYGGRFYATGTGTGIKYGVYSEASAPAGSFNPAYGTYGVSSHAGTGYAYGSYGSSTHDGTGAAYGGRFYATGAGTGIKYGVYGSVSGSGTLIAGYFGGNVVVFGSLSKGGGSFLIDHPLDPQNKTLRHNFVESPENLCLYRGKVTLNSSGEGKVAMPAYFKALTKEQDASINLTPVGRPFVTGCEWNTDFTMVTVYGEPDRQVYYIVMADRDDPVMKQLYKPVEEDKGNGNFTKGKLLYPEAYGYSKEMGEDYENQKRAEEEAKKARENQPKNDRMSPPEGR